MNRRRRDRGVVLLLTMLVLMVLAIVVLQLAFSAQVSFKAASNLSRDLKNQEALRSGLSITRLYLKADIEGDLAEAPTPPLDHLGESMMQDLAPFEFPAEEGGDPTKLYLKIEDEEGKFYLPAIVDANGVVVEDQRDRLARMLDYAGIGDADTPKRIAAAIDKDTGNTFDDGVPNRNLYTLKELLAVPGITNEMFYGKTEGETRQVGLADILTLYGSGRVNINTASKPVLFSLSTSMKETDVDNMVSAREQTDQDNNPKVFQNTGFDELKRADLTEETYQTISGRMSVRSSWFRARMLARTASVERWASAVLQRVNASSKMIIWEDDLRFSPDPQDLKTQEQPK